MSSSVSVKELITINPHHLSIIRQNVGPICYKSSWSEHVLKVCWCKAYQLNVIINQYVYLDKRINEVETRLDEMELENKREMDKLQITINKDKVSRGENCNNKNKNMILENDYVNIGSDNESVMGIEYDNDEMLMYSNKLERKFKESIIVGGLQGVDFSLNDVVGGEVRLHVC